MRGKVRISVGEHQRLGITPAYAGKSAGFGLFLDVPGDHPRICGEKLRDLRMVLSTVGSPPHMRGKVFIAFLLLDVVGDHPRICGEKQYRPRRLRRCLGSPPHMRGKGEADDRAEQEQRITPAYAGKSSAFPLLTATERDHPRICGEKIVTSSRSSYPSGSPPHMRGKAGLVDQPLHRHGITPAYAGKSFGVCLWGLNPRDHPRICGEKGVSGEVPQRSRWITPAYAGKRTALPGALYRT